MYISAESLTEEDKEEVGPEFIEAQHKVIEIINKLPIEKRFVLLSVLAIDSAMIMKYSNKSINSLEDLAYAFSTLWVGPLKRACTIVHSDHASHFKKVKN